MIVSEKYAESQATHLISYTNQSTAVGQTQSCICWAICENGTLAGHFWVFCFLFQFSGSQPSWLGSVSRLSKTQLYFRAGSLKIIPQESLKTIPELRTGNIASGVQEHWIIWWNWSLDVLISICFQLHFISATLKWPKAPVNAFLKELD